MIASTAKVAALMALALASCRATDAEQTLGGQTVSGQRLEDGRHLYERYCAICHGEKGDGRGPSAAFLDPAPRDFRTAQFKYAGSPEGALAADEDLRRIVRHGLTGTAMRAWDLPDSELGPILDVVKSFSDPGRGYRDRKRVPTASVVPENPWADDDERISVAVATGERLYHQVFQCSQCHPTYASPTQMASWDSAPRQPAPELPAPKWSPSYRSVLVPPDFLRHRLRSVRQIADDQGLGHQVEDVYRLLANGMQGPMPGYGHMPADQLWAVSYYVKSLADLQGSDRSRQLARRLSVLWAQRRGSSGTR